MTGKKQF